VPIIIDRHQVQRLVGTGAQVVEVLPRHEYDDEHLPGALHLPLKHLNGRAAEAPPRRARPRPRRPPRLPSPPQQPEPAMTPTTCGLIMTPIPDIYSEAPQAHAVR
jgi:rhodanese-related sulfurtransferase